MTRERDPRPPKCRPLVHWRGKEDLVEDANRHIIPLSLEVSIVPLRQIYLQTTTTQCFTPPTRETLNPCILDSRLFFAQPDLFLFSFSLLLLFLHCDVDPSFHGVRLLNDGGCGTRPGNPRDGEGSNLYAAWRPPYCGKIEKAVCLGQVTLMDRLVSLA